MGWVVKQVDKGPCFRDLRSYDSLETATTCYREDWACSCFEALIMHKLDCSTVVSECHSEPTGKGISALDLFLLTQS